MLQLCKNQPVNDQFDKGITFYVVGDKFSDFSDSNTVLTLSQAHEHADLIARIGARIVIGQGLSPRNAQDLQLKIHSHLKHRQIRFINLCAHKVAHQLVHKRDARNVLITRPQHTGELKFSSHLVIDENCSEMSDHQSGEHIQGVLLIEAARQLFMASTLSYNVVPELDLKDDDMKFTLTEMTIRYEHFVFPVDAQLTLQMYNIESTGSTASGCAKIDVFQFNKKCCEVVFEACAYSTKFLDSLERRCARKARKQLHLETELSQAV